MVANEVAPGMYVVSNAYERTYDFFAPSIVQAEPYKMPAPAVSIPAEQPALAR